MKLFLAVTLAVVAIAGIAFSQSDENPLAEYKWVARPLVVFADSEFDPRFIEQMKMLAEDPAQLEERDVVILTDTDPATKGPLRIELRPRDFMIVLIDKEGRVVLRKPSPWTVRELTHAIDKLPLRKDELSRQ
ncbi:MAG TPA: DUF4174 domain-containing protein [Paracoccaceae bacterium]|nr:DUF4174 domain-containing protein [Paracoccaceae bacterium]